LVHSLRRVPTFADIQRSIVYCAILFLCGGGIRHDSRLLDSPVVALYFAAVTGFTVGYGDFLPVTNPARLLAMSGMFVIAILLLAWFPVLA
jgi:hypothetical protein